MGGKKEDAARGGENRENKRGNGKGKGKGGKGVEGQGKGKSTEGSKEKSAVVPKTTKVAEPRPELVLDHEGRKSRKDNRAPKGQQRQGVDKGVNHPGKRSDGDGGVRATTRPDWLSGDTKMKNLDLHRCNSEEEALREVAQRIQEVRDQNGLAFEIIVGSGKHTELNKYGRDVKETGNWKNKNSTLFQDVKKLIAKEQQSAKMTRGQRLMYWIPPEKKLSTIYIGTEVPEVEVMEKEDLFLPLKEVQSANGFLQNHELPSTDDEFEY